MSGAAASTAPGPRLRGGERGGEGCLGPGPVGSVGGVPARARVAVVGGGFAGLAAVRALASAPVDVTLVDRRGRHVFQPLLYRVAVGDLEPSEVAVPLPAMLGGQPNVALRVDEVRAVDAARRCLVLAGATIQYDFLVLAAGATPCYLGHDGWRRMAPPLRTLEDAVEIRRRLRAALAAALAEHEPFRRAAWLTFAVVGGGPTGVELAAGIAETAAELPRAHPGRAARVVLLERGDRLLRSYPDAVAREAHRTLESLGVEVRTGAAVAGVAADGVRLPREHLAARTVLWAAGVAGPPLAEDVGAPLDAAGRVEVRPDLSVPGSREIFAVGDMAAVADGAGRLESTAAAASAAGRHAAENVLRALGGARTRPFRYRSPARVAAVGRARFVGHVGPLPLPSALATLAARLAHARWLWPWRALPAEAEPPLPLRARSA